MSTFIMKKGLSVYTLQGVIKQKALCNLKQMTPHNEANYTFNNKAIMLSIILPYKIKLLRTFTQNCVKSPQLYSQWLNSYSSWKHP